MIGLTMVPLWFYNPGTTPALWTHTVYMGASNIAASVELSGVNFGTGELTNAAAFITQHKYLKDGVLTTVPTPSNAIFAQNCVEITFAIGGMWAGGAAVSRILYF